MSHLALEEALLQRLQRLGNITWMEDVSTGALEGDSMAPLVETVDFQQDTGPLEVRGSGTVQASETVTVGAEVGGRLVYVNPAFREGRTVPRGATLFRVNPVDYQNQVRTARADVAAQDVAVLQAREELEIAREELDRFAQRQTSRSPRSKSARKSGYCFAPVCWDFP